MIPRILHAVCVYMAHDIMAHLFFPGLRHIVVDLIRMGLQLIDLFLSDAQSQLLFCLSQGNPQPSPGLKFHIRREDILHLLTGVTLRKRAYILIMITHV